MADRLTEDELAIVQARIAQQVADDTRLQISDCGTVYMHDEQRTSSEPPTGPFYVIDVQEAGQTTASQEQGRMFDVMVYQDSGPKGKGDGVYSAAQDHSWAAAVRYQEMPNGQFVPVPQQVMIAGGEGPDQGKAP